MWDAKRRRGEGVERVSLTYKTSTFIAVVVVQPPYGAVDDTITGQRGVDATPVIAPELCW